ncbi:TRAP transporter small permease [Fusobacterium sp. IOR10]|uniref:TRAP transporter small permease n=1 Tax=Fusobacterium sp. IOR10 TaxID=2665157 RepID=UPI0013D8A16D|nr:TRAP transporter small permease [Fusobacterium sp. IOR10]
MEKTKYILDKIIEMYCIAIMGLMTILVTWQVFIRYIFNKPNAYTEQISQYLFVWLVLYGSAYVFGKREHMQISFLRDKSPKWLKNKIDIFQEIIIMIFTFTVMVYGGYYSSLTQMNQVDAALQIPIGIIYSAIPISGLFVIFYSVYNIRKILFLSKKDKG